MTIPLRPRAVPVEAQPVSDVRRLVTFCVVCWLTLVVVGLAMLH